MAVRKINELGYQRIGLAVPEDQDRRLGGNFIGGFSAAQKFLKLVILPPLMLEEKIFACDSIKGLKLLEEWLGQHKPDAVLTSVTALPEMLRKLGRCIPKDIGVAGTSLDVPVDAGIDQHSEAIGRMAVEMLVSQINLNERGEPEDPARILIESRWRGGQSLPPKKQSKRGR
jgi:LacI family transcriptional regulator